MNVLVIGSGGREHAIALALARSAGVREGAGEVFVAPGNGGTDAIATNVAPRELDADSPAEVIAFCGRADVGLVVIGPEAPLVAGLADELRGAGIDCFGPGAAGAMLEGSKSFSKDFMRSFGLPTADYETFTDMDSALAYLGGAAAQSDDAAPVAAGGAVVPSPSAGGGAAPGPLVVVKADGLAAGKGVVVAETLEEAREAVRESFGGKFGDAGKTLVIEECLSGPECSVLAFVSGADIRLMDAAQDHKRALEGDKGPNTGGMGVYSPVPIVTDEEASKMAAVMQEAATALAKEGVDYRGVLYGGFMLTESGPKLLEFNVRFGDPETQVLLPRLKNDFLEVALAVARGSLGGIELEWDPRWAVSVVLASEGYPGAYPKGLEITGVEDAETVEGVTVYHAGTRRDESGRLLTNGGRVLNVTALAPTFEAAREAAYTACDLISFEGKQLRRDIGAKAARGRSAWE
jgi:phosphoribosylamine--glycine ligase